MRTPSQSVAWIRLNYRGFLCEADFFGYSKSIWVFIWYYFVRGLRWIE